MEPRESPVWDTVLGQAPVAEAGVGVGSGKHLRRAAIKVRPFFTQIQILSGFLARCLGVDLLVPVFLAHKVCLCMRSCSSKVPLESQ